MSNNSLTYFPKYFSSKAIGIYFVALALITILFFNHALKWYWCLFGIVEVTVFFHFSNKLSKEWSSIKNFSKKLFWSAWIIRVLYVIFSYFFYKEMTGIPFTFGSADEQFYHNVAQYGSDYLSNNNFNFFGLASSFFEQFGFSDSGYPLYLTIIYWLTGNSIIIARLLKATLNAFTCVFAYKIARQEFGESVGRMAGIFSMLLFNMIYYCGTHLKEIEMLFLVTLFIERANILLRNNNISAANIIAVAVLGISLFFVRTALGAVAFLALGTAVVLSSSKIVSWGKKTLLILFALMTLGLGFGNKFITEATELWGSRGDRQETSMQWRSERKNGNSFAKYAGAAVFAPMIFTIPFPTMVETPEQEELKLIHGGNFTKNITSFFTIVALISLVLSGEWRKHVLPLAYIVGYLAVITLSEFAQSERFHFPTLPIAMMLAAYGVSIMKNKHKSYYIIWILAILLACVAWSWFKLKGRGMV